MTMTQRQDGDELAARAVVFLDRDGTINKDIGYAHRVADWEFLPGAVTAIQRLRDAGFLIAVVTNQSGVGGGKYTGDDVERLHAHVQKCLADAGTAIDAWAFCPHTVADDCDCRKPRTGLVAEIARQLAVAIDYEGSWMIGDKVSDLEFGRRLGVRSVILRSRYWTGVELRAPREFQADSLDEAMRRILSEESARQ